MKENKLTSGSNLMWESSRMMLPEHVEAILEYNEEIKKEKKPVLDEQELEQIQIIIMESLQYTVDVKITYLEGGYFEELIGVVSKVDMQLKQIKLETEDDYFYVFINCIVAVERL